MCHFNFCFFFFFFFFEVFFFFNNKLLDEVFFFFNNKLLDVWIGNKTTQYNGFKSTRNDSVTFTVLTE